MKKQLTAAMAAALLLTGCGGSGFTAQTTDLSAKIKEEIPAAEMTADLASAQYQFTLNMLQAANAEKPGENLGFAPVLNALGIAAYGAGAAGETRTEIESCFGGMNADDILAGLNGLRKNETNVSMHAALSFWFRDDKERPLNPKEDYLRKIAGTTECYSAPFDDSTLSDMNKWISKQTGGAINDLVPEITVDEVCDLLSAMQFDAKWKEPYADNEVQNVLFYQADGTQKSTPFLIKKKDQAVYLSDENAVGLMRSYADGRYCFAALMPLEIPLEDYIAQLTPEGLQQIFGSGIETEIYSAIPAFSFDCKTDLVPVLKKMGIQKAYDPDAADFSGITDGKMNLSRAVQQLNITVDRNGTKASFALNLSGEESSAPEYHVALDKPFIWFIYDSRSELPVLAGTLQLV